MTGNSKLKGTILDLIYSLCYSTEQLCDVLQRKKLSLENRNAIYKATKLKNDRAVIEMQGFSLELAVRDRR